ncbi:MAG: metal ABC transporter substrate-binding protein [Planctomycetota bacterium]
MNWLRMGAMLFGAVFGALSLPAAGQGASTAPEAQASPPPARTAPTLRVVATVPAWGELAREIGGELVEVVVLCRPGQDLHTVSATPTLMARVRGADLVLATGLDAESWLEPMLAGAGLALGSAKVVTLSEGVALKDVPAEVSRAQGDVHAYGNPHVWTDPVVIRQQAPRVLAALLAAAPASEAEGLRARYADFQQRFGTALVRWLESYRGLRGTRVVSYHASWRYLFDRFGIEQVGTLEPKPRVAPTASHLAALVELMREREVKLILREPWNAPDAADFLAGQTGARVLELATHPGAERSGASGGPADAGSRGESLIEYYDRVLAALAAVLIPAESPQEAAPP